MLRSMYSGISGLKNFQTKLDVIGNNVANVNTFGFKKGRVTFSDTISQTISGATAPSNKGGSNSKQVGLGSSIASIDTLHTQGSMQNTGRQLDLAISGNGYFVVNDGTSDYYTRAGNFYLDVVGNIVNSDGMYLGTKGTPFKIESDSQSFSIGKDGTISIVDKDGNPISGGIIEIAIFPNPEGLDKAGTNLYRVSSNSGAATPVNPGTSGAGTLNSGFLRNV